MTGLSPRAGALDGGRSVTITGTGFSSATAVSFGASDAAGFTVNSDTSITAISPAGSEGTVDVTVIAAGETSAATDADQFTYEAAPVSMSAPSITGTAGLGRTLTCQPNAWSGNPSYRYRWNRNGAPIGSARGYVVQPADQGHTLTCTVTATTAGGSSERTSGGVLVPAAVRLADCTLSPAVKAGIARAATRSGPVAGTLVVRVSCDQASSVQLRGTLRDVRTITVNRHRRTRTRSFRLAAVTTALRANTSSMLRLALPVRAVRDLLAGARESVALALAASDGAGTSNRTATIARLAH